MALLSRQNLKFLSGALLKVELSKGLQKRIRGVFEKYEFEVGVLDDRPHYQAESAGLFEEQDLKTFAGGPARKISKVKSDLTIGEIFVENMKRLNIDLLREPFKRKDAEINKLIRDFFRFAFGKTEAKRLENTLQAVVRNPILRQEYGPNKGTTADGKGFDRHLIDTAQMFRAIKARVRIKSNV